MSTKHGTPLFPSLRVFLLYLNKSQAPSLLQLLPTLDLFSSPRAFAPAVNCLECLRPDL